MIRIGGDDVLVALSSATAVLALFAVWHGLIIKDPRTTRLRDIALMRRTGIRAAPNHARRDIRQAGISLMRQTVERFHLMRGRQAELITNRLARAGWRSKDALTIYLFAKAFLPILLGGGGLLLFGLTRQSHAGGVYIYYVVGALAVFGLFGTDIIVKNAGDKRIKALTMAVPDALDLMVICAEAGLSLDSAIKRVGQELAAAAPAMSDEFLLTGVELYFLPDRQQALLNLVKRTDMPKLRAMVNSLIQSERFGTPLANSLRVLSVEFRDERLMKAEEKAAKLPAIMTIPMIMFILPSLFMIIIGPAILHILDQLAKQ